MIFSDAVFLFAFLPLVYFIHILLTTSKNKQLHLIFLIVASLVFYLWWNVHNLILFVTSIAVNYILGLLIERYRHQRFIILIGVMFNVVLLMFFKYSNMLLPHLHLNIILPLAISFFTFQQIAYLVDVSREGNAETSFIKYSFFVSFFPQLIAGPILSYREIRGQVDHQRYKQINKDKVMEGLSLFIIGLFKKVLIADIIAAPISNAIFSLADSNASLGTLTTLTGIMAFYLQIYFDFSGYSDMARGMGAMFGFTFPINFESPYRAGSPLEFWRRWHITLSRFLQNYIYIPLGGSKQGEIKHYVNLMLTMLIGGIWHGASWTFLVWGGAHGLMMIINQFLIYRGIILKNTNQNINRFNFTLGVIITNTIVALLWVLFRAPSFNSAAYLYKSLFLGGFDFNRLHTLIAKVYAIHINLPHLIASHINIGVFQTHIAGLIMLLLSISTFSLFSIKNSHSYVAALEGSNTKILGVLMMMVIIGAVVCLQMNNNAVVTPFIYFQF